MNDSEEGLGFSRYRNLSGGRRESRDGKGRETERDRERQRETEREI